MQAMAKRDSVTQKCHSYSNALERIETGETPKPKQHKGLRRIGTNRRGFKSPRLHQMQQAKPLIFLENFRGFSFLPRKKTVEAGKRTLLDRINQVIRRQVRVTHGHGQGRRHHLAIPPPSHFPGRTRLLSARSCPSTTGMIRHSRFEQEKAQHWGQSITAVNGTPTTPRSVAA